MDIVKMFKREGGFTLVELMVVVLIIGILVAIAVPVFNSAKAQAQANTCKANRRTIDGAVQQYLATNTSAVASSIDTSTVLAPDYIKTWPKCPSANLQYTITDGGIIRPTHAQGCLTGAVTATHDY